MSFLVNNVCVYVTVIVAVLFFGHNFYRPTVCCTVSEFCSF